MTLSTQPTKEELDFFEQDRQAELEAHTEQDVAPVEQEPESEEPEVEESEVEEADESEADEGDEKPKYVPHAALHRERQKRKQIETELAELRTQKQAENAQREELQATVATMRQLMQRMASERTRARAPQKTQPAAQPQIQIPDYNTDPIGHLAAKVEILTRQLDQPRGQPQPAQQLPFQDEPPPSEDVIVQVQEDLEASEGIVREMHEDYDDTIKRYVAEKVGEQIALGFSPQQANMNVHREIWSSSKRMLERGLNPALQYYKTAKRTLVTQAPPPPATPSRPAARPAQRPAAPAVAQPPAPPPTAKVAAAQAAQRAVKSLTGADGKTRTEIAAEDLIKRGNRMSDKEFLDQFNKLFHG